MASVQQGEKQLFEKFWRGTFKAVATPRPGSVIVASITARRPLPSNETPSCLLVPAADKRSEEPRPAQETSRANGCVRSEDGHKRSRHKSCSPLCDEELTPPPAREKKKKKKSVRKKRRRSPSCSPSPVKKKKKKKKSSKKRKRSRLSSKKRRHSSSPKNKWKEDRKRKKHSRSQPQKSQRCRKHPCHSGSDSTSSLSESCRGRLEATSREESHKSRWKRSRRSSKSARKPNGAPQVTATRLQNNTFLSSTGIVSESGSSADLFKKTGGPFGKLANRNGETHEYDSGNDTSSPPSTQTSFSRSKGSQEASCQSHDGFVSHAFSSGSSDSGNSFTSCVSRAKGAALGQPAPSPCLQAKDQRGLSLQSLGHSEKKQQSPTRLSGSPSRPCLRSASSASRSSPESAHSHVSHHKAGPKSSPSRSCSSRTRSYSRSPSSSSNSCKRSPRSRSSGPRRSPSYSRYSPSRDHERESKYDSSGKESHHRHRDRRRRKQSYSPMRKRRRDSPSHLEARRITSARKRPVPYYRPSPSSSSASSASSYISWYSSFSRTRSHSSDRTSRSRSWTSGSHSSRTSWARSGRRSGSRSSDSAGSCDSGRH